MDDADTVFMSSSLVGLTRANQTNKHIATCFFLGIVFSAFPYDYPLLWSRKPATESNYNDIESHMKLLFSSPPLIQRILHIVIALGLVGLAIKLVKPSQSNLLFDGASLVLYFCGITVYSTNIVKGFRLAEEGRYGDELAVSAEEKGDILGREESLKVYSASNTILGLVLVGILVLQSGQWYAERKNAQEEEESRNAAAAAKKKADATAKPDATATGGGGGGAGISSGVETRATRAATRAKNA